MKFPFRTFVLLVGMILLCRVGQIAHGEVTVTVDPDHVLMMTGPDADTGVTYNQHCPDIRGHDEAAVQAAEGLLQASCRFQNAQFISWGMPDPEPGGDPAKTGAGPDWTRLNARLQMMVRSGATPIITFCGAPAWMTGTPRVDTKRAPMYSDEHPDQLHYVYAFATLCAQCAAFFDGTHGRPRVARFQVWNEFKGMFDPKAKAWDARRYTVLYNAVFKAVKRVRPDAKIGGPYIVLTTTTGRMSYSDLQDTAHARIYGYWDARVWDAVRYWFSHKSGADFVALDGHAAPKDAGTNGWPPDWNDFGSGIKFADAIETIRRLPERDYPGAATLPIDFAEWYCFTRDSAQNLAYQNAAAACHLAATIEAGGGYALIWGPEGDGKGWDGNAQTGTRWEALWADTTVPGGGRPTPFCLTLEGLHRHFPPGTPIYAATSSSPDIAVMAGSRAALLINTTPASRTLTFSGARYTLSAYEVRFVDFNSGFGHGPGNRRAER